MEQPFYAMRLQEHHGIDVVVPSAEDRAELHRIIFDELCRGIVHEDSRRFYRASMERLAQQGATAIILGCTEISMLVGSDDASVPLFDTTRLHALGAAEFALVPQDQENIR
jgi:aspartate racemase